MIYQSNNDTTTVSINDFDSSDENSMTARKLVPVDNKQPLHMRQSHSLRTVIESNKQSEGIIRLHDIKIASDKPNKKNLTLSNRFDSDIHRHTLHQGVKRRWRLFRKDKSNVSSSESDQSEEVPSKPKRKKRGYNFHVKRNWRLFRKNRKKASVRTRGNRVLAKLDNDDERTRSFLASLSKTVSKQDCHPRARVYRDHYEKTKEELCRQLYQLYNEHVFEEKLPKDMTIQWDARMRRRTGRCYNVKSIEDLGGIVRSSKIVLATKILDSPDRLRDSLIHEMCHAAVWIIDGFFSDDHGPYWKRWTDFCAMHNFRDNAIRRKKNENSLGA